MYNPYVYKNGILPCHPWACHKACPALHWAVNHVREAQLKVHKILQDQDGILFILVGLAPLFQPKFWVSAMSTSFHLTTLEEGFVLSIRIKNKGVTKVFSNGSNLTGVSGMSLSGIISLSQRLTDLSGTGFFIMAVNTIKPGD